MSGFDSRQAPGRGAAAPPPSINGMKPASNSTQVPENLRRFQQAVQTLVRLVECIGVKPVADSQLRSQISECEKLSIAIGQQLSEQVQDMERKPRQETAKLRAQHQKLSKDYHRVTQLFKNAKQRSISKQQEIAARGDGFKVLRDPETAEADRKLQIQMQDEALHEAILQEREQEIKEIHSNVQKVNEIFHDLAEIVNDQQEEIDSVESMIERSHQHAKNGLSQVEKANQNNSGCSIS